MADEKLIMGRNLTSNESMPVKSKLVYEEVIQKNFDIIQTFLKKFTIVFNSKDDITQNKRCSKLN